jgi:PPK2 family polyphosphate:nucleotide phosphotransferase
MSKLSLNDISCRAPGEFDKEETNAQTAAILEELKELQNLLYAENKHSLLIVIQGMDAAGKDGLIRDVLSFNPQGIRVHSFKVPTERELSQDFLWRIHRHSPAKRMIQVFNRSHYEDIIVTRVHKLIDDDTARKRMKAINDFEKLLVEHNSTQILKFYLHVSEKEQEERLKERIEDPRKMWKYNEKDKKEASRREEYIKVYEECFENCNDPGWIIVPSDQNWYKEYLVAKAIRDKLVSLDMNYPVIRK